MIRTILLGLVWLSGLLGAQVGGAQALRWERSSAGRGGARGQANCLTPDGGFLVAGLVEGGRGGDVADSARGSADMWAIKYDAAGVRQWDHRYGGPNYDDCTSANPTRDGGYILGGYSVSGRGGEHSGAGLGDYDYWVLKVDALGRKLWDRTLATDSMDQFTTCFETTDGHILVTGFTELVSSGGMKTMRNHGPDEDAWIVKLDGATGAIRWDRTLGGAANERIFDARATPDGGCIIVGMTDSEIGGDVSTASPSGGYSGDVWVLKLDASGHRQWDRRYGGREQDSGHSVVLTSDGGYVVAGLTESGVSGTHSQPNRGFIDVWVLKLTATGALQWERNLGTADYEFHTQVVQLASGGYVVSCNSTSGIDGDRTQPRFGTTVNNDIWAVGLSAGGAVLWDRVYGGTGHDACYGHYLTPAPGGGFRLVGWSDSPVSGNRTLAPRSAYDLWIVQADASGTKTNEWVAGASSDEVQQVLLPTANGGLLAGGQTHGTTGFDRASTSYSGNHRQWWLVQRDSLGAVEWDEVVQLDDQDNVLRSLVPSRDQGLLLAGTGLQGGKGWVHHEDADFVATKIRGTGADWQGRYGGPGEDWLAEARPTTDNGFVLGGTSRSRLGRDKTEASRGEADFWLLKTNATGVKQWDHRFGGTGLDSLVTVRQLADGGYLLAGSTTSPVAGDVTEPGRGGADYWLVKVNNLGVVQWQGRYGGPSNDWLAAARPTPDGGYVLLGTTTSGIGGEVTQASRGGRDLWVVKVSSLGVLQWQRRYGGSGQEYAASLEVDPDGGYILGASTSSPVSGDVSEPSRGGTDYWLLRIGPAGGLGWDRRLGGSGEDVLTCLATTRGYGYAVGGSSNSPTASGQHQQPHKGGYDYWTVLLGARRLPLGTAAPALVRQLALYPNPTTGRVTLQLRGLRAQPAVRTEVLNALGQVVQTTTLAVQQGTLQHTLDWSGLAAGLYTVRLQLAEGPVTRTLARE